LGLIGGDAERVFHARVVEGGVVFGESGRGGEPFPARAAAFAPEDHFVGGTCDAHVDVVVMRQAVAGLHEDGLRVPHDVEWLAEGARVSYQSESGPKGPKAVQVQAI